MTAAPVKERPIIFGAESVRAILEGRKTETRRVMPQPWEFEAGALEFKDGVLLARVGDQWHECREGAGRNGQGNPVRCPYGNPGDRLWVRETWCQRFVDPPGPNGYWDGYYYAATDATPQKVDGDGGIEYTKRGFEASPWKSPIFMPREASRLTLEVTEVRVERLQEITEEGAIAEGMTVGPCGEKDGLCTDNTCRKTARDAFAEGWDALNAKRGFGWDANPWVWVVRFRRVEVQV
jgi:hypothetical protein